MITSRDKDEIDDKIRNSTKQRPVSKADLMAVCQPKIREREVRLFLEDLSEEIPIGSNSRDGGGYYLCQEPGDVSAAGHEDRKRAVQTLARIRRRFHAYSKFNESSIFDEQDKAIGQLMLEFEREPVELSGGRT